MFSSKNLHERFRKHKTKKQVKLIQTYINYNSEKRKKNLSKIPIRKALAEVPLLENILRIHLFCHKSKYVGRIKICLR